MNSLLSDVILIRFGFQYRSIWYKHAVTITIDIYVQILHTQNIGILLFIKAEYYYFNEKQGYEFWIFLENAGKIKTLFQEAF